MSVEKGSFPKSVKIFGRDIEIVTVKELEDGVIGQFLPQEGKIELLPASQPETLLHEMIHASLHYSGLSSLLDDKVEEAVCICLEYALTQYFKV